MPTILGMDATPERLASQMSLHARLAEAAVHSPVGWTGLAEGERFPIDTTVGVDGDAILWVRFYIQSSPVTASCLEIEFEGAPIYFAIAPLERNRAASILVRFLHSKAPAQAAA